MNLKQEIEKMVEDGEICAKPDPVVKNQWLIGYDGENYLVGVLDKSPFIDGVLDMDAIKPFMSDLMKWSGGYFVVWDIDTLLRKITPIHAVSNSHLTRENIDMYATAKF